MTPLPMTVISGYLGAGKTTLVNRLLAEDHGLRLMILVNDFGAINIDADLLQSRTEDTIALQNGCVCCTMGADLFMALGDALDRRPRPDHLVVEASGVADPASIARAAIAEPEMSYAGIVTLVDGLNAPGLLADDLIAAQVGQQISAADLVLVTKTDRIDPGLGGHFARLKARGPRVLDDGPLAPLLFGTIPLPKGPQPAAHPAYAAWSHESARQVSRAALVDKLSARPEGLYRLKGFVLTDDGGCEVQVVGRYVEARRAETDRTRLVGLGPADRVSRDQIEAWWSA
ncbi:MAG: GTP-binding protein [Rhodobacteraceae bacterium]|nr:MAG: GTP-binding protein [Paracoccaceae bacterium]